MMLRMGSSGKFGRTIVQRGALEKATLLPKCRAQGRRSGFAGRALFHGRRAIFSRGAPNRALARRGLAA
jgi:hypothetical protein